VECITVDDLKSDFTARFGAAPTIVTRAPGRVNLIGEHTDYNDGFVLPMAIGCGTLVAARGRDDGIIRLHAVDLEGAESSFSVRESIVPDATAPWSNYARGVADSLQREGLAVGGADVMITGNVPRGAGLSSSASFEVAFGLALAVLAGCADFDRSTLALAGQRAEHLFAGCKCGIMDQLVSAHGVAGHATLIDCRTLGVTPVAMPGDVAVLIVHSGIERGLVDGEYNLRRAQCEAAVAHYGVAALRDLGEETLIAARRDLDETAFARARHVVSENRRTIEAAAALADNDLQTLGRLMAESHASMRDDFAITTPAIDRLAALLHTAIGGEGGARMTGGGFGGAVVAVMRAGAVDAVVDAVMRGYQTPAGEVPLIMRESPSAGAAVLA
jgi:galactokinase